jgi:hypothetical protein
MMIATQGHEALIWGWLRLVLGFAQISLAGLTIGVLITAGITSLTVWLAISTSALTLASQLIYRGRKGPKGEDRSIRSADAHTRNCHMNERDQERRDTV